jgi:hypothetical protein
MAYRSNPFLERMSEKTASDQDFVQLFSPKILEKLPENAVSGGVHVFRSAPGAGKTTLFRAFTPLALRSFWNLRGRSEHNESFQRLVAQGVLSNEYSPSFLGTALSCAAGYADLPPTENQHEGVFRALLDCRVVLRTLRSLTLLIGAGPDELEDIEVVYDSGIGTALKYIPQRGSAKEIIDWAEQYEQNVYAQLDTFVSNLELTPQHERFESVLWLQSVVFTYQDNVVAPKRMLMLDDLHRLRRKQRALLIDELIVLRPNFPIWLAERTVALGEELLSQGGREGRDINQIDLDNVWAGKQFASFAQNILDRRMSYQDVVASRSFGNCLRGELTPTALKKECKLGIQIFSQWVERHKNNVRYSEWLAQTEKRLAEPSLENVLELYLTRILMIRDESRKQMSLDLALSAEEIEERDSSQVRAAAELFMHFELKIPYYFSLERLCVMATSNVEELLFLAATLYEGLQSMQILRKPEVIMAPNEQEKLLKNAAQRKWDFIPKNHTDGLRAQRLLESIALFCKDKTYLPNAPYAPGVTGVRLSREELNKLTRKDRPLGEPGARLARVLAECAAENLVVPRPIAASTNRDSGTVFYLNRTLCALYDLPLQMGGWQEVSAGEMIKWMERRITPIQLNLSGA